MGEFVPGKVSVDEDNKKISEVQQIRFYLESSLFCEK